MTPIGHPYVDIKHARYWRGVPHAWSTRYIISGPTPDSTTFFNIAAELLQIERDILYGGSGGGTVGGFLETRTYTGQGGAPTNVVTYGQLATPSSWLTYNGAPWVGITGLDFVDAAEACFEVRTPLQGLSSRGKPVYLRKFFHSVGQVQGDYSGNLPAAAVTQIAPHIAPWTNGSLPGGRVIISPSGRQSSGPPTVQPYLGNHQMPRGRKRRALATSSNASGLLSQLLNVAQDAKKILSEDPIPVE